jgi:hypothetical protein
MGSWLLADRGLPEGPEYFTLQVRRADVVKTKMHVEDPLSQSIAGHGCSPLPLRRRELAPVSMAERSSLLVGTSRADDSRLVALLLAASLLLFPSTASAHTETGSSAD